MTHDNCNDCFIGDYQTGTAKLVPATQFDVDMPGVVVIPENEKRCNPFTENCGNASDPDYWDIHDDNPHVSILDKIRFWLDWMTNDNCNGTC